MMMTRLFLLAEKIGKKVVRRGELFLNKKAIQPQFVQGDEGKGKEITSSSSSSSSSSTDSNSDSSSSSEDIRRRKKKKSKKQHKKKDGGKPHAAEKESMRRFEVVHEQDLHKWDLPESLAEYANPKFRIFIPDKDIKEQILVENPVPENLPQVKKLDNFMQDILVEKFQTKAVAMDNIYEKFQRKNLDVMGPLSRLWHLLEQAMGSNSEDENATISIADLLHCVEQTVTLVGQNNNTISYHRRLNILNGIMTNHIQAKTMLKEKASLLEKDDENLFGKDFREQMNETLKAKKQTREVMADIGKPFSGSSSQKRYRGGGRNFTVSLPKNQVYRDNNFQNSYNNFPNSSSSRGGSYRKQNFTFTRGQTTFRGGFNQRNNGKYSLQGNLQHYSRSDTYGGLKKGPSCDKKIILRKFSPAKCSPSRETNLFRTVMGKTDKRSKPVVPSKGIQNSNTCRTFSRKTSPRNKNEFCRKTTSRFRNRGNVEEGSHFKSGPNERPISKQLIPCRQKGWGHRPVINLKKLNKFIPYQHFKMEGLQSLRQTLRKGYFMCKLDLKDAYFCVPLHKKSKKFVRFRWSGNLYEFLYLSTSSPGHFFSFRYVKTGEKKRFPFLLARLHISKREKMPWGRGCIFMFWARSSSSNFHQIAENSNCYFTPDKYKSDYLFERHALNGQHNRGSYDESGHSHLPITAFRFCDKPKEVGYDSNTGNSVFDPRKNSESKNKVQGSAQELKTIDFRIDQVIRPSDLYNPSRPPSEAPMSLSAETANPVLKTEPIISKDNLSEHRLKKRINLVDTKFGDFQWKDLNTSTSTSSHPNGCLADQLGGNVQWDFNRRGLDCGGTETSYQYSGAHGSKISNINLYKNRGNTIHSFPNRQYGGLDVFVKNGWNKEQTFAKNIQGNLDISVGSWDHDYCRISAQCIEQTGRLGITPKSKLIRVETFSKNVSKNLQYERNTQNRLVCLQSVPPDPKLCIMATRPSQSRDGRNDTGLEKQVPLCIPPFSMITRVLNKVLRDKVQKMILITPAWPSQPWYPEALRLSIEKPVLITYQKDLLMGPTGLIHPLVLNHSLTLVAWVVTGNACQSREFQKEQPNLSQWQGERVLYQITNRPGKSGLAGVVKEKLIHFEVM